MAYDFIADIGVDGGVLKLKGETTRAFGVAPEHFLHSEFINHVAEAERLFVSDLLFDVQQGQDRVQETVTLLNGTGQETRFTLEIGPVFRNGTYAFTRIGAKKLDPFDGGAGAGSAYSQGLSALEDTLFTMIDKGETGRLSLFSVGADATDAAGQGAALHALLTEEWEEPGQVARLNDRTTALIHDATVDPGELAANLSTRMGPGAAVQSFSIDLGQEDADGAAPHATIQGVLAAAAISGMALGEGLYTPAEAAERATETVTAAPARSPTPIAIAGRIDDPDVEIGIAVAPELTHDWTRRAGAGDRLTASVVNARLRAISNAKPAEVAVVVPIDAGSLLMIGGADWDRYDLMAMPLNLRALDSARRLRIAELLSKQYVMADVADLAACPEVFAALARADALSFLRADTRLLTGADDNQRAAFLSVIQTCAERGIYLWLSGADAATARDLLGSLDTVFLSTRRIG